MIFENQGRLNTLKSFVDDGFKIERDGKVITLSSEEMRNFRYLDKAYDGRRTLEYGIYSKVVNEFAEKYLDDETVCFELADKYYDAIADGTVEMEVVCEYIDSLAEVESLLDNENSLEEQVKEAKEINARQAQSVVDKERITDKLEK